MRHLKASINLVCCLVTIILCSLLLTACKSGQPTGNATYSQENIKEAIASGEWIFIAQNAIPQGGRSRMLDTRFDVRKGKDTLVCYLPYFGRSFSGAGAYGNSNPLDFKSTTFTVEKEALKKQGTRVRIKPTDINAVQYMTFELYESGSATLNVVLTDRTPMTYYGRIEPIAKR